MDQYQDDSGSDEGSITLETERGDAVIVYGCNDQRYSPPVNHVTKVLIGSSDPNPSIGEITIFTNESASGATYSANTNHKFSSPFFPSEDHGMPSQSQVKPYQELAEALSHLTVGAEGKEVTSQGSFPVSPTLSRKFRSSLRADVSPPSKNPFLTDANAAQSNSSVLPNGSSPGNLLDLPNSSVVSTGIVPQAITQHPDTISMPLSGEPEAIIDPPGAFQSRDLLGNATILPTISESSQSKSQPTVATVSSAYIEDPISSSLNPESGNTSVNVPQTTPPDVTVQSQKLDSQTIEPPVLNHIQPALNLPDPPTKVQIVNAACSQELPPIQESLNTPDQSVSSFHYPEPPRPAPLVCVPVKEVKFEEPPKHQIVTALENAMEKLGEIVQITVQPCHTTQNVAKAKDEPNAIALPTYSATQFQSKAKDCSNVPSTTSNQANNSQTELKTNNLKIQEAEIPADQAGPEESEYSYGIIGNEDNLSDITLPPLNEGSANHRDHDGGAYNNGHPRHRIRISIDHQSATPSRRTMVITVLLVVLLISTVILFGVYKFVHKSSPD